MFSDLTFVSDKFRTSLLQIRRSKLTHSLGQSLGRPDRKQNTVLKGLTDKQKKAQTVEVRSLLNFVLNFFYVWAGFTCSFDQNLSNEKLPDSLKTYSVFIFKKLKFKTCCEITIK